jgi:peptidyl-prolyl cis-trans isomerase A (cyclophilin A)
MLRGLSSSVKGRHGRRGGCTHLREAQNSGMQNFTDLVRRALCVAALTLPSFLAAQEVGNPEPAAVPAPVPAAPAVVNVLLHTARGDVRVALEKDRAPKTVANFLKYVDAKRFDGITFYRAVKISEDGMYGLMQAGLRGNPKLIYKPIPHESTKVTGLSHFDGTISMAMREPGTATADFFFVLGDLTSLDAKPEGADVGYAAFGRVTDGLPVLRSMLDLPKSASAGDGSMKGQMLAEPVKIISIRRVD